MTTDAERSCPHCGGTIKVAAKLCKHCKRSVEVAAVEMGPTVAPSVPARTKVRAALGAFISARGLLSPAQFDQAARQQPSLDAAELLTHLATAGLLTSAQAEATREAFRQDQIEKARVLHEKVVAGSLVTGADGGVALSSYEAAAFEMTFMEHLVASKFVTPMQAESFERRAAPLGAIGEQLHSRLGPLTSDASNKFRAVVDRIPRKRRRVIAIGTIAIVVLVAVLGLASRGPKWIHVSKKSEMTDEVGHSLYRESDEEFKTRNGERYRPSVGLRIEGGQVRAYLATRDAPKSKQVVAVRFDDEPAIDADSEVDIDKRRITFSRPVAFGQALLKHRTMKIQYETLWGESITASWTLRGFERALLDLCTSDVNCTEKGSPQLRKILAGAGIELQGGELGK